MQGVDHTYVFKSNDDNSSTEGSFLSEDSAKGERGFFQSDDQKLLSHKIQHIQKAMNINHTQFWSKNKKLEFMITM